MEKLDSDKVVVTGKLLESLPAGHFLGFYKEDGIIYIKWYVNREHKPALISVSAYLKA